MSAVRAGIARHIATTFGLGDLLPAPGTTAGSLPATLLWLAVVAGVGDLGPRLIISACGVLVFTVCGCWAADRESRRRGSEDPGAVVIDGHMNSCGLCPDWGATDGDAESGRASSRPPPVGFRAGLASLCCAEHACTTSPLGRRLFIGEAPSTCSWDPSWHTKVRDSSCSELTPRYTGR